MRKQMEESAAAEGARRATGAAAGSIRLVDAYSIEQFSGLVRSIEKLFPNSDDFGERNRAAEIDSAIRTLTGGAWWNAGQIVRERRGYILSRPYRELPDLPPQVRMIEVHVDGELQAQLEEHRRFIQRSAREHDLRRTIRSCAQRGIT